jgi:hypothetical protein
MHSHDLDLIAALAEGRLEADAAATAEAAVADCLRCAADLAAHRTALEAIATSPPVALTEQEVSTLRTAVAEAIGIATAPAPTSPPPRRVPWGAIALAGASLAAIVAVVPVLGLLSTTGGDDAGTDIVAATMEEPEPEPRLNAVEGSPGGDLDATPQPAEAADEEAAAAAPITTTMPATTIAAEEVLAGRDLMTLWEAPEELQATLQDQSTIERDAQACADAALEVLGPHMRVIAGPLIHAETPVVAYVADVEGTARLVAFDPDDCSLVLVLP